ncbi:MAG: helix-turn-helix transcriptional regulator [Lachnospiraceae bacterium]|nr:helix-turn-helix transcriptional regulator [Lachnospiraceae bacterium]
MEIGTIIKKARNDAMITQEQAAETLGVSRQTISHWENGIISENGSGLQHLALVLCIHCPVIPHLLWWTM